MRRLPKEIVTMIRRYTYRPQCPILLDDIENIYRWKEVVYGHYYNHWIFDNTHWLANDLLLFMNSYKLRLYTNQYSESMYLVASRQIQTTNLKLFIDKVCESNNAERSINILAGLMTPAERAAFIANHC